MKPRSQTNLIYISPQQQHHCALDNLRSTTKTISSMKPQPLLPSDQSHKEKLAKIIKGLNNKSANGPDDVSAKLLKIYEEKLSPILANHINASLPRGQFPGTIKRAKVTTIFKAGDRANVFNYRPISVQLNLPKIIKTHINRGLNCSEIEHFVSIR
jgi:hypothetical protein